MSETPTYRYKQGDIVKLINLSRFHGEQAILINRIENNPYYIEKQLPGWEVYVLLKGVYTACTEVEMTLIVRSE